VTARIPHSLVSRLTDGGEVGLTHRPRFAPRKMAGTYFGCKWNGAQGHTAAGRIQSIEKCNEVIDNDFETIQFAQNVNCVPSRHRYDPCLYASSRLAAPSEVRKDNIRTSINSHSVLSPSNKGKSGAERGMELQTQLFC
jgi:hypothetical protein